MMLVDLHLHLLLIPLIITLLIGCTFQHQQAADHLFTQLHQAKLKLAHLEAVLKETAENVEARTQHLVTFDKKIDEMDDTIRRLHSSLKDGEKINALEEEARELWASLRKNNFDLHVLESRGQEAEERLQELNSRFQNMAEIVTEQWIQIQQFEQALQLTQTRLPKSQRPVPASASTLLKFINELCGEYLQEALGLLTSTFRSYMLQILHQLERLYSAAKEFHHELQGHIKQEMERHEFTVHFANKELIFLVVSAIIVLPVMGAWMLLSSQLS